jgi:hypothetical protein
LPEVIFCKPPNSTFEAVSRAVLYTEMVEEEGSEMAAVRS